MILQKKYECLVSWRGVSKFTCGITPLAGGYLVNTTEKGKGESAAAALAK